MKSTFVAKSIVILNFSKTPDDQDMIIPPQCQCDYKESTPVVFDDSGKPIIVGSAQLYRKGNRLLADLKVNSVMDSTSDALHLLRLLSPAVIVRIKEASGNMVTHLIVEQLLLTPDGNIDPKVKPLGNSIRLESNDHLH